VQHKHRSELTEKNRAVIGYTHAWRYHLDME
jgi:hypothetical protein